MTPNRLIDTLTGKSLYRTGYQEGRKRRVLTVVIYFLPLAVLTVCA